MAIDKYMWMWSPWQVYNNRLLLSLPDQHHSPFLKLVAHLDHFRTILGTLLKKRSQNGPKILRNGPWCWSGCFCQRINQSLSVSWRVKFEIFKPLNKWRIESDIQLGGCNFELNIYFFNIILYLNFWHLSCN